VGSHRQTAASRVVNKVRDLPQRWPNRRRLGSSGNSSGPHLHFEVHVNAPPANRTNAVDPVPFLRARKVPIG
jgi:hypothetical protein